MVNPGKSRKQELSVWDNDKESWDLREIADKIESRHEFKYISDDDTDQLFVYEEGIWKEKGESIVRKECMNLTNELLRSNNIGQVKRIIKTRNEIYIDEEGMETKDYIVPFQNGVYDIKKEEFRDFEPEDNLKWKNDIFYIDDKEKAQKILDFDLDNAEGKIDEFLNTIVDTERKKQILRESIGLALMTNYPIDEAPILHGKGSNGKNMFVELVKKMSGNWHSINLNEATDDKFAKASLEGCGFVFFDEVGHIKDPEQLKSYTGDEDMNVRRMQTEPEMGKQTAIPLMATNELPTPPEQNDGWFRRFPIVDFPYKFTDPNKNDGHKDKRPRSEIEEEYFNEAAISLFATQLMDQMTDVLKNEGFTSSYSTDVKRHRWNMKSSIVYTFLDLYVEQGELPDQSTNTQADTVRKDKLLEMCNDFIEMANETKIRSHELTQAIKHNPDLETGTDQRVKLNDGTETRAYSGLRMVVPSFQDYQGLDQLEGSQNRLLLKHSDMFRVERLQQLIQALEIAESEVVAKTLQMLKTTDSDSINLMTLIRELKLSQSDVDEILSSNYINKSGKITDGFSLPEISIDEDTFDKAIKESDMVIEDMGELKRPKDWLIEKRSSWSHDTRLEVQELVEKGENIGFSEKEIEEGIDSLLSDGMLHEPEPGVVSKL